MKPNACRKAANVNFVRLRMLIAAACAAAIVLAFLASSAGTAAPAEDGVGAALPRAVARSGLAMAVFDPEGLHPRRAPRTSTARESGATRGCAQRWFLGDVFGFHSSGGD